MITQSADSGESNTATTLGGTAASTGPRYGIASMRPAQTPKKSAYRPPDGNAPDQAEDPHRHADAGAHDRRTAAPGP